MGFVKVKYVGDDKEEINCSEMKGLNLMDKTLLVNGARISYSIWEVEGKNENGIIRAFPPRTWYRHRRLMSPDRI